MRLPASALSIAIVVLACTSLVAPAHADDDRFALTASGFHPTSHTRVSADAGDLRGETLDFEDRFALARKTTRLRLDGMLRLGDRHRLVFNHYDLERRRSTVIDETIRYDGQTFPIDTLVSGRFDFSLSTLSYEYAVVETPSLRVGAQIGAHWARARIRIRSHGTPIADVHTRAEGGSPALGLRLLATPGGHWRLGGYVQAFKADIGNVDARFTRAGIFAEYRISTHLGAQLGHDWFKLDADYAKPSWNGRLDLVVRGPSAGLTLAF
ncbi:MAG TPA: hypothetical protein PKO41_05085 [Dokdonella sp.]|uniref:hypothetical protein n=1 Tax=Dokdonella sp. TaxID=2291710 RepID=UPI0025BE2748|nr:hypothetical protein [Dokdonella sp.]MBX3691106.1 hypothetical protein [Dokdonella sp.]MCW5567140.1 hypothetical protein [Dokdonella sp.]HNR91786.1 hypothetical protein [Dokdonella sp.]